MKRAKDELDRVLQEMFEEGQALLPEIDRICQKGEEMCGAVDYGYKCSKRLGHEGDHAAHGVDGGVCHRWSNPSKYYAVLPATNCAALHLIETGECLELFDSYAALEAKYDVAFVDGYWNRR